MSGHDVPAEGFELQLGQRPPDDRGRCLGRSGAGQLAFRGERDAGDASASIPGRLADEQELRCGVPLEVVAEAVSPQRGSVALAIEVERRADAGGGESSDEPFGIHGVTMLMRVRGCVAAFAAAAIGVCVSSAQAAPPQGFQTDAAFAASYASRGVSGVVATAQHVSCYAPQVLYTGSLGPSQGYPDGGATPCAGSATTGESVGPFPTQSAANPPLRAKDFSESDIHVDPTNSRHVVAISKWFVNVEGYNHLTGFYESFDGGVTWPQQGHVPGYEGWTDNTDPVGAFDPWGNFYVAVLAYMFDYLPSGSHRFAADNVNPARPRSVRGIAVRPRGATTPATWNTVRNGALDTTAQTPFNGAFTFDKQWIAIDTNRRSKHFGRVYVSWAIGADDNSLRIFLSYADARPNGTHTNWSRPRRVLAQADGIADNGSLPRVTPDGRVWLAMSSARRSGAPYTMSFASSRNGGRTWTKRRLIVRHQVNGYRNTTFRAAFGEAFDVGTRKVGRFYPLYAVYEAASGGVTRLFIRGSFDGGLHWRTPLQVNDSRTAADALQPNVAVAPNGGIVVAFYDRRLPCATRDTPEATVAGLLFDPRSPYGRANYCINAAAQFYTVALKPLGHNIRLSPHTWDPQLSSPRPECICSDSSFIGDYFGVEIRGGFAYTTSVETYNAAGENPGYHQQQLVSKLTPP